MISGSPIILGGSWDPLDFRGGLTAPPLGHGHPLFDPRKICDSSPQWSQISLVSQWNFTEPTILPKQKAMFDWDIKSYYFNQMVVIINSCAPKPCNHFWHNIWKQMPSREKNTRNLCASLNEKPSNYVSMDQNEIAEAMKLNPAAVKPNSINELYWVSQK